MVHFYNRRGTAEQWIKEGKYALTWTRLSSYVVDYYRRAPRGRLTTRYHGHIIGDNSDEGQDASLRVKMGNTN